MKGSDFMLTVQEKQIIESLAEIVPRLPDSQKLYLLGVGEGMVVMSERQQKEKEKVIA